MNRTEIFNLAWNIAKTHTINFATALRQAWNFAKSKAAAKFGTATVNFIKKDGTVRNLTFTVAVDFIPTEKQPKSNASAITGFARVFDVLKQDWVSFHAYTLVV